MPMCRGSVLHIRERPRMLGQQCQLLHSGVPKTGRSTGLSGLCSGGHKRGLLAPISPSVFYYVGLFVLGEGSAERSGVSLCSQVRKNLPNQSAEKPAEPGASRGQSTMWRAVDNGEGGSMEIRRESLENQLAVKRFETCLRDSVSSAV